MFPGLDYERRLQALERFMREIRGDRGATAPVAWTPQLYQNGDIASTDGGSYYAFQGNLLCLQFYVTATAAGSAGNRIEIRNLPFAALRATASIWPVVGAAWYDDQGTTEYNLSVRVNDTPALLFNGYNANGAFGAAPSLAVASTDILSGLVWYWI
jgi:hypothetical protein